MEALLDLLSRYRAGEPITRVPAGADTSEELRHEVEGAVIKAVETEIGRRTN